MHRQQFPFRSVTTSRTLFLMTLAALMAVSVAVLPGLRSGQADAAGAPVLSVSATEAPAGATVTGRGRAFPARRAGVLS